MAARQEERSTASGSNLAVRHPSRLIGLLALVLMSGCAHKQFATENKGRELKNEGPVIADTASGQVRGTLSEGLRVFKGIPYGAPTSGKNRFMPPVRPEPCRHSHVAGLHPRAAPHPDLQPPVPDGE